MSDTPKTDIEINTDQTTVEPCEVTVQIEITKGDHVKYEVDHESDKLVCDRILHVPVKYRFNYGYIVNTMGGDGDPLDAVVICDPLQPTCYIQCKILGALKTTDEKGKDEKVILVPIDKVDGYSKGVDTLEDVNPHMRKNIEIFFQIYKEGEKDKWVKIEGWMNREEAITLYHKSKVSS